MYDLVIVGSGPAGLSAAVYAKRAGLNLLVLEKEPMSGGQVLTTYEVDNYLGLPGMNGFDMGMKFREHADKLGVEFKEAELTGIEGAANWSETVAAQANSHFTLHTTEGDIETKSIILACGAHHAHLNVPGEEELAGMGVSYCATCDGAFFKNRTTAVVGGGDVALEDAIYLARFCEKVYLIHRRDEFRGAKVLQEELMNLPNVEILYSHVVDSIQGEDMVEAINLTDVKTGAKKNVPLNGVFVAVGIHPNTDVFKDLLAADEGGYIIAGEDGKTNVNGIFVAGDIRQKPIRQIITAVADGANAAVSATNYLNQLHV